MNLPHTAGQVPPECKVWHENEFFCHQIAYDNSSEITSSLLFLAMLTGLTLWSIILNTHVYLCNRFQNDMKPVVCQSALIFRHFHNSRRFSYLPLTMWRSSLFHVQRAHWQLKKHIPSSVSAQHSTSIFTYVFHSILFCFLFKTVCSL